MRLYGPVVYRWCLRAGLQDSDAADVGQEVFRAVNRAVEQFVHDKEHGTFRGWLRAIVGNKIRDFFRKQVRQPQSTGGEASLALLDQQPAQEPRGLPDDSEADAKDDQLLLRRHAVELSLEECDEQTRAVFWRVVADQAAPRQVAQEFNITANAVYLIKSRLLRRIREEFKDLVELDPAVSADRSSNGLTDA